MASIAGTSTKVRPVTEAPEVEESRPIGLCVTCNNGPTCLLRAKRGADALFCELFDDYAEPNGNGSGVTATLTERGKSLSGSSEPGRKGLCLNCEHRDTCMLPKPESGVWHCEEYE